MPRKIVFILLAIVLFNSICISQIDITSKLYDRYQQTKNSNFADTVFIPIDFDGLQKTQSAQVVSSIILRGQGDKKDGKITYAYDSEWKVIAKYKYIWEDQHWVSYSRELIDKYYYPKVITTTELWQDGTWIYSARSTSTTGESKSELINEIFIDGQWHNKNRFYTEFNDKGAKVFETFQNWRNDEWVGEWRDNWEYDQWGNETLYTIEFNFNNNWVLTKRRAQSFTENGKPLTFDLEEMSDDTLRYKNGFSTEYNSDGKTAITISYYAVNNQKTFESRHIYEYEDDNKIETLQLFKNGKWSNSERSFSKINYWDEADEILVQVWKNDTWLNDRKYLKVYNSSGMVIEAKTQVYINNIWEDSSKRISTYESGRLILVEDFKWLDNNWIKTEELNWQYNSDGNLVMNSQYTLRNDRWLKGQLSTYEYDNNGHLILSLQQLGDFTTNQWVNANRIEKKYDNTNYLVYYKSELWEDGRWISSPSYVDIGIDYFECSELSIEYTSVNNEIHNDFPISFRLGQNWPNPFNPTTKINFDIPKESNVKLYVFNSLGQLVSTVINQKLAEGYYRVKFDGTGLSSGVYFYRLEMDGYIETKKMMLIK